MQQPGTRPAFAGAARVLREAIARRVFPGAVAEVGGPDGPWWRHAAGALTYEPAGATAALDTLYDLASLTKVVCTTTLVMRAMDRGSLGLDTALADLLPGWRGDGRERVRIEHLLAHASGLPAWLPLYATCSGREAIENAICGVRLAFAPGSASVYSDLGFILLGFVLEDLHRITIAAQFEGLVAQWAGPPELAFSVPPHALPRTAPTQEDEWRGRSLRGEVDDRNAFALGGIAGHAGLFGTAPAVGVFARRVLQGIDGAEEALGVRAEALHRFTTRVGVPGSSRALGWDTMLATSSCGTRLSPRAFGHTGFTGTSLWIDPERQLYAVLLSNRVHPTAGDPAEILAVRRAFHDAIA